MPAWICMINPKLYLCSYLYIVKLYLCSYVYIVNLWYEQELVKKLIRL